MSLAQTDTIVLDTEIFQRWESETWTNRSKREYIYNKDVFLKEFHKSDWKDNSWETNTMWRYYYDSNLNLLKRIPFMLEGDEWVVNTRDLIVTKRFYSYDSLNNIIEYFYERFTDNKWTNVWRHLYKYNINNELIEEINLWWEDEQWENRNKKLFFYNNLNNIILEEYYNWENNDSWEIYTKKEYGYNEKDSLIHEIFSLWRNENWMYDYKNVSYRNELNQIDSIVHYNYTNERFVKENKIINKYDKKGNRIQEIHQEWIDSNWQNKYDYLYDYDTNNMPVEEINRHANSSNGELENYSRCLYIYKTILTSVNENDQPGGEAYCYPNPVISQAKLSFETKRTDNITITIFDCLGNEIMKIHEGQKPEGRHEIAFDASMLPSGVYYCRINGGGANETVKMSICR